MIRVPDRVRAVVLKRDRYACVRCGLSIINRPGAIHHRRPRGAGGSRAADTNTPANLITLCGQCHERVESHREHAFEHGWLVHSWDDPSSVSLLTPFGWVYVRADGDVVYTSLKEAT